MAGRFRYLLALPVLAALWAACLPPAARAAFLNFAVDTPAALASPPSVFIVRAGSAADAFSVAAANMAVTVPAGSRFTVTLAGRNILYSGAASNATVSVTCDSAGGATLDVPSLNTRDQSLSISPADSPCGTGVSGGTLPTPFRDASLAVVSRTTDKDGTQRLGLAVNVPGPVRPAGLLVSYRPDFESASWQPYVANTVLAIPPGVPAQMAYAMLRDTQGYLSPLLTAPIPQPRVLGAAAPAPALAASPAKASPAAAPKLACPYFSLYAREGMKGTEVEKIQEFLAGQRLLSSASVRGTFDAQTAKAVRAFQAAHAKEILQPVGAKTPTGLWLKYTVVAANRIAGCK